MEVRENLRISKTSKKMARGMDSLLSKHHKFGAQRETLRINAGGKKNAVTDDLDELEKEIRSILISLGKPCRVSEICRDYKQMFGKKFPTLVFGESNPVDIFKKIPGACEILEECSNDPLVVGKTTEKSAHISRLVEKSKKKNNVVKKSKVVALNNDVFIPFNVQDGIRQILYKSKSVKINRFYEMLEDRFDKRFSNLNIPVGRLVTSLPHILHLWGDSVKSVYSIERSEVEIPSSLQLHENLIVPSYRLSKSEIEISENISLLLKRHHKLPVNDIPRNYERMFGKKLNWYRFGFHDLWRFLSLLKGDFALVKVDDNYVIMRRELNSDQYVDIRTINANNVSGEMVFNQVLEKIQMIVFDVNDGLNVKHFESTYETAFYEKLIIKENLLEFLEDLHQQDIVELRNINNDVYLFPNKRGKIVKIKTLVKQQPLPVQRKEFLKPGDSLPSLPFPKAINIKNQELCTGYVTYIESPNDFYIRFSRIPQKCENSVGKEFKKLLMEMQKFYLGCSDFYRMKLSMLRLDMVCAANVRGQWSRARVVDVAESAGILVRLLDEGSCHVVTLTNLMLLHVQFARLPALAAKAMLFNIQPMKHDWSFDAIFEFFKFTSENCYIPRELCIVVIHRNVEGKLIVHLTNMCSRTEIHIGDQLVNGGFAKFKFSHKKFAALYFPNKEISYDSEEYDEAEECDEREVRKADIANGECSSLSEDNCSFNGTVHSTEAKKIDENDLRFLLTDDETSIIDHY